MCGIVGVTGGTEVLPNLLDSLGRLEYRGYDSAGVVLGAAGLPLWRRRRAFGTKSLADLAADTGTAPPEATWGLGHVRWATHGRPSETNAHPHTDCSGRLALVHNGIIENYLELGDHLSALGHQMASETDTEVLAHLIEQRMSEGAGLEDAVANSMTELRGAFALAVVHADEPGLIVAARRVSPLVLGRTEGSAMVASDIPALLGKADEFFVLDDDQLAVVRPGSIVVTDSNRNEIPLQPRVVEWDLQAAERGGFDDFMSKEIHEQPTAIADTLLGRLLPSAGSPPAYRALHLDEERLSDEELRAVDKVFVVACGSSFHAGLVAKHAIEHWARLPVEIDVASEFRYRDPVLDSNTLVVAISQSGETVDTLQAARSAAAQRAKVLAVTNVVDSSMARESDAVLYTRAGPEIGVAATKTHLTQIIALEILALYLAQVRGLFYPSELAMLLGALGSLPEKVARAIERGGEVEAVAQRLAGVRNFFFLGRHVGYPVALEGALKLKEISYLRAEGYPAGELKHGPIALIEPGSVVVAVATRTPLWEKVLSNVAEVRARGATVVLVANEGDDETAALADEVLWVPAADSPLLAPVIDVVPLQLLAYHLARAHGNDVDRPRNLAKTVTVE
ncbi:MAG: glutamine--fructose-6-phosphate transaminase (isomerizing) [Actinomycetota bacterium]|nr:glutamine--fructose-6-phosphate transaminase (isomerizing) [Actinomycetota bacterium]